MIRFSASAASTGASNARFVCIFECQISLYFECQISLNRLHRAFAQSESEIGSLRLFLSRFGYQYPDASFNGFKITNGPTQSCSHVQVIYAMLGIPFSDYHFLSSNVAVRASASGTARDASTAAQDLMNYMNELVSRQQARVENG